MKVPSSRLCAIVAGSLCTLCAGAGAAQGDVLQRAPQLKIYSFGQIDMSRHEVVGRVWGDSWRSAYRVQTFPSQEQAISALQTEAARRGADGLLNVECLDVGRGGSSSSTEPAFLCYGIAIRARPGQG